jgi:DtxR family Mn-dependent transcriptional regulator
MSQSRLQQLLYGGMVERKREKKNTAATVAEHRLSMAMENYLLSILRLGEQGVKVTLTQLSEHLKVVPSGEGLGTSLPTVGGMIRRMIREGLVEMTPNKDVVLTTKGKPFAESILRRHRLAERFVVDVLGLELKQAHIEAHRLEHAMSPEIEQLIVQKLGNPTTCPFGHPIPGSDFQPPKDETVLAKAKAGGDYVVCRIPEDDQALLEYFVDNLMIPGEVITVKEISMPRGVISLQSRSGEIVFGYEVSKHIWVRPATP